MLCSEFTEIKKYLTQMKKFQHNVGSYHHNEKMYFDKYFSHKNTQFEQELYNVW